MVAIVVMIMMKVMVCVCVRGVETGGVSVAAAAAVV